MRPAPPKVAVPMTTVPGEEGVSRLQSARGGERVSGLAAVDMVAGGGHGRPADGLYSIPLSRSGVTHRFPRSRFPGVVG
ncbi:hypothetical protein HNR23_004205 [Nocardiopsis mwathae]|uniref:Uncharacterized protein n=1 Tax=Nocardiopsis mwathae TaxID=1472723 RepID=A0A7W9YL24_9ACTN|nr:hypothetical protein [Nocardiopsis mwathae]